MRKGWRRKSRRRKPKEQDFIGNREKENAKQAMTNPVIWCIAFGIVYFHRFGDLKVGGECYGNSDDDVFIEQKCDTICVAYPVLYKKSYRSGFKNIAAASWAPNP